MRPILDALSPLNVLFEGVTAYSPMLIAFAIAAGIGVAMLVVGWILFRPNNPTPLKQMTYECGIEPEGDALEPVIPRYYIYGMLFLAFDVEAHFLFPWAVVFDRIGMFAFIEMVLFILVLLVGLFYAWAKGALDWHY